MSDHIEAMARKWIAQNGGDFDGLHPEFQRRLLERHAETWAAGVGAVIAHEPCGGTNVGEQTSPGEVRFDTDGHKHDWRNGNNIIGGPFMECLCGATAVPCPGPHTIIDKGDGTKLYAMKSGNSPTGYGLTPGGAKVPLPSEWRIE